MKVEKLQEKHKRAFMTFSSELDKRTTHDYTHFGYDVDSRKAANEVFGGLRAKKALGYILIDGEKMAGFGHLDTFQKKEKGHVMKLGIVLHPLYQGKGLGKMLLDFMVADAERLGKEKIWLATYSDNPRALSLFRSRGFVVEGVFSREEKVEGEYRDVVSMALFLGHGKRRS
jgi:ribosomal protein S18 acetylase RimI-like enzyme